MLDESCHDNSKCDPTVAMAVSLQTQEDSGRDGQIINKE